MDSKLIQGLLIASCLFLLFGIGLTVADVLSYKDVAAPGASPKPAAAQPAEAK